MNIRLKRLFAAFIDFYIICFTSTAFIYIVTFGKLDVTILTITAFLMIFYSLYVIKDFVFKNASIGKKLLKIEIVKSDQTKFNILDALKRTIPFIFLFPIEIALLIIKNNRLGDIWAKTQIE